MTQFTGGKAANLARLRDMGLNVPAFVAIPGTDFTRTGKLKKASAETHRAAIAGLEGDSFAVRSSATDEDGAQNSFAGQFLSILSVPQSGIEAAAAKVFLSGHAQSVADYRHQRGQTGDAPVSVIVQRMIDPLASGVIFTADPVSSRTDRMVVNAVQGIGEGLMAGEVSGWSYVLDAESGQILEKTEGEGDEPLSTSDLSNLVQVATGIADRMGSPQDVEWAIDADGLHILQSRPITTLQDGTWRIWDNSNIVESYPDWVSPLTFSFARSVYAHVYRRLLADLGATPSAIANRHAAFEGLLGRFNGRVYYELGNWHRLLSALPAYRLNAGFMDQMMGVDEPLPAAFVEPLVAEEPGSSRFMAGLRTARAGIGLAFRALTIARTIAQFRERLDTALDGSGIDFETATPDELLAHWRQLERDLLSRWDAPLLNDLMCMIAVGVARGVMTRWGGEQGTALFNQRLIGQGDIVSAEPPRLIRAMAEIARGNEPLLQALRAHDRTAIRSHESFAGALDTYIEKFGDRCAAELKLESRTLADDPGPVFDAVVAAAGKAPVSAGEAPTEPNQTLLPGHPIRSFIANRLLNLAARRVRDRENLRFDRTRVFGRVRKIVRAMGERLTDAGQLGEADDVFLLTVDELQGAIEGWGTAGDLKELASLRRAEAECERARQMPDRFETRGATITATPIVPRTQQVETGSLRTGLGCSAGRITATARVVLDPANATLGPGDVLVARNTDPGWIALFANAGAVVVEKGSILSHSAIVAREMNIPCVVGVKAVTDWIPDGATIEVDGAAGTVRIVQ